MILPEDFSWSSQIGLLFIKSNVKKRKGYISKCLNEIGLKALTAYCYLVFSVNNN